MSAVYRLHTPENVAVSYNLAGIGSRFLAAAIDTLIQSVLLVLVYLAAGVALGLAVHQGALPDLANASAASAGIWLVAALLVIAFLVLWGYYVAFELLWNGQTPGKRLAHLRVLRDNGYPIGVLESLVRNLVRVVDFLPAAYGIGVATMLIDPRSRRLGDLAAGTIVVKERGALRAADLRSEAAPWPDEPASLVPNIARLTAADYSLLREYLLRREGLAAPARAALARELAAALARRLDTPAPADAAAAEAFLADAAAAYRAHQGVAAPQPAAPR